jgi:crossover junction endodeoxyribonuclease RuvC
MRIAGVDPGTLITGVGIIEESPKAPVLVFSRAIRAGNDQIIAIRLETIFQKLKAIFEEWKPEVLALENVFFQKDFRAAIKVGEARAIAMLAATVSGIPVVEYTPAQVKQSVCGNGRATKDQIQYMIRNMFKIREALTADAADALAVALCHSHSRKFIQIREAQARV